MKVRNKSYVMQVTIRDRGLCRCCGFKGSEVHHIVPLVYGGEDHPRNMVLVCSLCHRYSPNTKEEFFEYIKHGGTKLNMLSGKAIALLEEQNLPIGIYYPQLKQMIRSLREIDRENCFEQYSLKQSLEVEDIDFNDLITKSDRLKEEAKRE